MNTEQERADFEAWLVVSFPGIRIERLDDQRYVSLEAHFMFEAYQAGRAALQSQDREDGFSDGVLLALQMMTDAGDAGSHLHFELIKTAGLEKIVRRALQEGMWEL